MIFSNFFILVCEKKAQGLRFLVAGPIKCVICSPSSARVLYRGCGRGRVSDHVCDHVSGCDHAHGRGHDRVNANDPAHVNVASCDRVGASCRLHARATRQGQTCHARADLR